MNDYERVARVIRYLDQFHTEQPSLDRLAQAADLSPSHFHRLFSSWAAITPKDFLQCLTLAHARKLLQAGQSVLDTALDTGMSGPGRLHDLCITLEAATPGELKSGGEGLTILAGFAETPFGEALIAESSRGICHLSFVDGAREAALEILRSEWPKASFGLNDGRAKTIAAKIFARASEGKVSNLRAFVHGTPFQIRVWNALLRIQPGTAATYGRLAREVGQPTASRAVGNAVGQNPISYLIPCHRVIRETGMFGNYRWDPIRKRAMLAWESGLKSVN